MHKSAVVVALDALMLVVAAVDVRDVVFVVAVEQLWATLAAADVGVVVVAEPSAARQAA